MRPLLTSQVHLALAKLYEHKLRQYDRALEHGRRLLRGFWPTSEAAPDWFRVRKVSGDIPDISRPAALSEAPRDRGWSGVCGRIRPCPRGASCDPPSLAVQRLGETSGQ